MIISPQFLDKDQQTQVVRQTDTPLDKRNKTVLFLALIKTNLQVSKSS